MKRSSDLNGTKRYQSFAAYFRPGCIICVILALLWLDVPDIQGADDGHIYQWKDDKGVVHFSNIPPEKPVKNLERMQEVPYDPEKDQARMREDEKWQKEMRERAEQARRQKAEEEAAKQAEEERLEAKRRQALVEARQEAEEARVEAMERQSDTNDKTIFVNPSNDILGINPPPRPHPRRGGRM